MAMENYEKLAREIDNGKQVWIERLREAVAIPSVSADASKRRECFRMVDWAEKHLSALGVECGRKNTGDQTLPDGSRISLPPVLFGVLGNEKSKKTLLVYGHLDVQPADKQDGWNTEPFELIEQGGKLYGRGSTDDKGPVIAWLNVLEAFKKAGVDIPVNIKFVFEAMEESGSEGLDGVLLASRHDFLNDVDYVCISDNYWLGKKKPCLTYGLRGLCYYQVEVTGPKQDLHSGIYGGVIHEPMADLCWVLGQLTDEKGKIMIEGLNQLVAPLTEEEKQLYANIDFSVSDMLSDTGVSSLCTGDCPRETLMARWRYPSLSIHGIEGAFSEPGAKTVIPSKVKGKFSIRLVPNMEPPAVNNCVTAHLHKLWAKRRSPNNFCVMPLSGGQPWVADYRDPHYTAGAKALEHVYGVRPDLTREGGSIPVTLTLQQITGKSVMLLPIGACDDMAHSQNEKLDVSNYINGMKVFIAYLLELSKLE